jgi:hypothetical protein
MEELPATPVQAGIPLRETQPCIPVQINKYPNAQVESTITLKFKLA